MSREYKFKIDAYSPDTIPMARLAEYLSDLASLMGFRSGVHFSHLEEGSVVVVQKVDYENIPKVEQRIRSANRGDGPKDAMTAIRSLDRRLSDDNAVGHLLGARDAEIIRFPGRERPKPLDYGTIRERATIQGQLVRIGGKDATSHALLQDGDVYYSNCELPRDMARDLSHYLYGATIRMFGVGRWKRDLDGEWGLEHFKVEGYDVLDDKALTETVSELRSILPDRKTDGDIEALRFLRDGDVESENE
tara:strand:- start:35672 stop:36415 length:744 start_codon:yes stop_codon:yes gene_type:complete